MTNKETFNKYLNEIRDIGNYQLEYDPRLWPAELLANLAMDLYEKEAKKRIDNLLKKKDNVINLDRSSKPPVDSL